jgi:hypothetical protein
VLQAPQDVTADGSRILIIESRPAATDQFDLMALVLENPVRRETVIWTPGVEFIGTYSPDGRFVTNQTQEAGQPEVYVSPADGSARARFKVSADGGERPI